VGRPVYPSGLDSCKRKAAFLAPNGAALKYEQVSNNVNHLVRSWDRVKQANVSKQWACAGSVQEPTNKSQMRI
jgi:hypothetical protein